MSQLGFAVRAISTWFTPKQPLVFPDQMIETLCNIERRSSPRREKEIQLIATAPDGSMYIGYTRNISDSGICALIWGELRVGDEVVLTCPSGDQPPGLALRGTVRHSVGYRYGLQFKWEASSVPPPNSA